MRSKLFVPASRPDLFAKALASKADALSFDLEDAVAPEKKTEARDNLHAFLDSTSARASGKTFIVRINPMDSEFFDADLKAVLHPRLDLLNLPKAESTEQIRALAERMQHIETQNEIGAPIHLLLTIESPAALRHAHELAGAHPRVAGLQLGLGDLFEPLAISRRNVFAVRAAMYQLRMAAGEAGIFACDSAFADIHDADGFRAEARQARDFGFSGKSCIHPSQIALANEVFCPTQSEIDHAQSIVAALGEAAGRGLGAYAVDGRMIDPPFIRRAQAILAEAERLGLLPRNPTEQARHD